MKKIKKKTIPVKVGPQIEDRVFNAFEYNCRVAGAEIGPTQELMEDVAILRSDVTVPRRKVAAAKWLLTQFRLCINNEGAALMFLELFATTLRSATFALQKTYSDTEGFKEWYTGKQAEMGAEPLLKFMINLRNAGEKEGLQLAEFSPRSIFRHYYDGRKIVEIGEPDFNLAGFHDSHFLQSLESATDKVNSVIEEAHARFFKEPAFHGRKFIVELVRENEDGSWEHFDPAGPPESKL